ncbi:hypothetical protein [Flavobacterium helocola]|uniref:Bacterial EndoU nuclease domain-containing protein n=1 Tax=Flavobacterium helocola TaxID=3139139 RepID=A0ABU9I828_9FLAO
MYDGLDDDILLGDNGRGAKGQFVKAVYNLWYNSKFNPYHENPILAALALNNFTYTPYHCRWQHEDPNILLPVPDYEASPMIINYESEKKFLWYIDNFKFEFFKNKIIAREDVTNYGLQPYGVYDIFQPISLKGVNPSGTIIRMPVLNMPNGATNPNDYIKNCLPIFYLMYVDDVGDRSDAKETIGTAINVALTFWGIGGVISNLRHLRSLSLVTRIGTLNAAEKVAFGKALSGLISASEAFFGAASFFHDFATSSCTMYYNTNNPPNPSSPEYQAYLKCKRIDNWLFALEMLSLSGDLLAKRALRHASRELAQSLGNDVPLQHRQIIDELADLDGLLDDFLDRIEISHPNIHARVSNFADDDKKFAFMFDFENAPASVLDDLNLATNPSLIDSWDEIAHLIIQRKNIDFLKAYKSVKNNQWIQIHTQFGHHELVGVGPATKAAKIKGAHMSIHYVNPPPGPGKVSWLNPPPKNTNPLNPDEGYTLGKIQRNMSDITDITPSQLDGIWKGGFKPDGSLGGPIKRTKGVENACWPKNYNIQRINEEKAFVLSKINANTNPTGISNSGQYHYEILATSGHPIKIIFDGNPNNGAALNNIFPSNSPELFL